jgi:hypothetical protein
MEVTGFTFDTGIIPGQIEASIPFVSAAIEDYLVAAVREQVNALVPPAIDAVEDSLLLSFSTVLLEREVNVTGGFRQLTVEEGAAELRLDLGVSIAGEDTQRYAGLFDLENRRHAPPEGWPVAISLHDDLINKLLFDAWRSGMLELTLTSADEPLLGLLFGQLGSEEGSLTVSAKLPPIAIQRDGGLRLEVGEIELTILTPGGEFGDRVVVRLAGSIPLNPVIADGELSVATGEPSLTMMVVESDWRSSYEATTNLLEDQLPIDTLLVLLRTFGFPLPAVAGLVIGEAVADRSATGVHTNVGLTLVPAPPAEEP